MADFFRMSWSPTRHQDLPVEMMDITEYVRADIADEMLAALEAVDEWDNEEAGAFTAVLRMKVHAAIATAKGEADE